MLMLPPDAGFKPRLVLEEKGRKMREINVGMLAAMRGINVVIIRVFGERDTLSFADAALTRIKLCR
jgi:hypothetical protein